MRLPIILLPLLLSACQTFHPSSQAAPASPPLSKFDIHAHPSVFSGSKLPNIDVIPPPEYRGPLAAYSIHTRYFDAGYNAVTTAATPGRYGAIVQLTTDTGQTITRFLTLFRTPLQVDWDGARMDLHAIFPTQLGISPDVSDRQRKDIGEFFKYTIQHAAQTFTNESNWQVAAMLAGLYEASHESGGGAASTKPYVAREGFAAVDQRWWFGLKQKTNTLGLPYQIYFPDDFQSDPTRPRPLLVFLHGSGEAGDGGPELAKLAKGGLPKLLAAHDGLPKDFPFIVLAPQLPPFENWSPYELVWLIDHLPADCPIACTRIYLTGLSLGGYGVWDTAIAFPNYFAAIAPIAGAGDPADVARIKDLPVWVFHGEKDHTIPVEEAHKMVDALEAIGAHPRLTVYPDAAHNSWNQAYRTPELYTWLLCHHR